MSNELERRQEDLDSGWDERQALKHWAELCGPSVIDKYVFSFLCDEIRSSPLDQVSQWQKTFCRLIEVMLRQGMPMELLGIKTYHEQSHQARNAEESLLISLNACARLTNKLSRIHWPTPEAFGTWIARLQGQRIKNDKFLIFDCFAFLDLCEVNLLSRELSGANLSGANLSGANLSNANLSGANLSDTNLSDTNLSGANLWAANLSVANLSGTDLADANLSGSNLFGANLSGSNLFGANLSDANLSIANLSGSNLSCADLSDANLSIANLSGANLSDTNLTSIFWDRSTKWEHIRNLDSAIGVPQEWLEAYQKPQDTTAPTPAPP